MVLVSLKENIDASTSTGKLLFTLMSVIAQFERDCIADRTREGLKAARARGRTGGRPKSDPEAAKKAVKLYQSGAYTIKEIGELTGIKKQLFIGERIANTEVFDLLSTILPVLLRCYRCQLLKGANKMTFIRKSG